jgi:hypothetical protein
MARGASSRASSEFSSVRARAYPNIWKQKTQAAIDRNIERDGPTWRDEAFMTSISVAAVAKILKSELPGHQFMWSDVVPNNRNGFDIVAEFSSPLGNKDKRIVGAIDSKEKADVISQHLSEGMDLTEAGRPLNLRRDINEGEEQKELDSLEKRRQAAREEKVADKRRSARNYDNFVKVSTARYYAEQKKENDERKARNG